MKTAQEKEIVLIVITMIELNKIYNMDCLEGMKQIEDNSIDLILTDPPYNVGFDYGKNYNDKKTDEEFVEWMKPRFREMRRVSKTVIISTGNYNLLNYAKIEKWKWLMCWFKPGAMGNSPLGVSNWEPMIFYGDGMRTGIDVIRACIIPDKTLNGHPCPKPLDWAKNTIKMFKNAETVLDPFIGSGTVAVASRLLKKKYIGFEINPEFCKIAEQRLNKIPIGIDRFLDTSIPPKHKV